MKIKTTGMKGSKIVHAATNIEIIVPHDFHEVWGVLYGPCPQLNEWNHVKNFQVQCQIINWSYF